MFNFGFFKTKKVKLLNRTKSRTKSKSVKRKAKKVKFSKKRRVRKQKGG